MPASTSTNPSPGPGPYIVRQAKGSVGNCSRDEVVRMHDSGRLSPDDRVVEAASGRSLAVAELLTAADLVRPRDAQRGLEALATPVDRIDMTPISGLPILPPEADVAAREAESGRGPSSSRSRAASSTNITALAVTAADVQAVDGGSGFHRHPPGTRTSGRGKHQAGHGSRASRRVRLRRRKQAWGMALLALGAAAAAAGTVAWLMLRGG